MRITKINNAPLSRAPKNARDVESLDIKIDINSKGSLNFHILSNLPKLRRLSFHIATNSYPHAAKIIERAYKDFGKGDIEIMDARRNFGSVVVNIERGE